MVRIIHSEKEKTVSSHVLSERSKVLLQMLSIVLAEQPQAIQDLLQEYQIELSNVPTDKERTEKLMSAVAACDHRFNNDLAKIILDCTLENQYDNFDFKGLFNKGADSGSEESSSGGNSGGGLLAGIANAVGGVGGAIGQGLKGRQAKDQATSQTLQGIFNYRTQLAANEKSKGKNKTLMMIAFFALILFVIGGIVMYKKTQAKQQL